jgi:hypothetical protein
MSATQRIKPEAMRWFAQNPRTMSKLVIATPEDWEEIKRDFIEPGLVNRSHIVLMPAADSLDLLLQRNRIVAELCIEEGLRMCTRMHIEIWDRLTGV